MNPIAKTKKMPEELKLAIGLIWGHLGTCQFRDAFCLAQGCLCIWPDQVELKMMLAYATIELDEALSEHTREVLLGANCVEWAALVFRRATRNDCVGGAAPC